jgi:hypothetical protein
MIDSMRSPNMEEKNTITPNPAAATTSPGHANSHRSASAAATALASPPAAPSTVFFGDMSVSLVRPRFLPTKYAPVSAAMMHATVVNVATRPTVTGGSSAASAGSWSSGAGSDRLRSLSQKQGR